MSEPQSLFVNPKNTKNTLLESERFLEDPETGEKFEKISSIFCLFQDNALSMEQWKLKAVNLLRELNQELDTIALKINQAGLALTTKKRLEATFAAKKVFFSQMVDLLEPLCGKNYSSQNATPYDMFNALIPKSQRVLSYSNNVFRDWAWGEDENRFYMNIVEECLKGIEKSSSVFIHGGGYGRFAADLFNRLSPDILCLSDINPAILLTAEKIIFGQGCRLVEFNQFPTRIEDLSREHLLQYSGPDIDRERFKLVLCDSNKPCTRPGSVDLVVTPWFIDINYSTFSQFAANVRDSLSVDGVWVNFGPLFFDRQEIENAHTLNELEEIMENLGFELLHSGVTQAAYLNSPLSRRERKEELYYFSARKKEFNLKNSGNVEKAKNTYLPPWILNPSEVVPFGDQLQKYVMSQSMMATILSKIDGKTSIQAMSKWAAGHFGGNYAVYQKILSDYFKEFYENYKDSLFKK